MKTDAPRRRGGHPPRAVVAAVAVLALMVAEEVVASVVARTLGPADLGDDLLVTVTGIVVAVGAARALWWGYRSARLLLVAWALANLVLLVVFAGIETTSSAAGFGNLVRGLLLTVLVVFLVAPATRRWCETGPEPANPADRAAAQRQQARAHLPWPRRMLAALRDDRDARR